MSPHILPASVGILGYGNMGRALVRGWLAAGLRASSIYVADASDAAVAAAQADGLTIMTDPVPPLDVVVLAVKPQQLDSAAGIHRPILDSAAVVLSIAAGKTLAALASSLGAGRPVVRSMPNTPAAISRGATVMCANAHVSAAQRDHCEALMAAVGAAHWVEDEGLMDAVTAVSGSGPAYVFLLIETLAQAGVRQGLPEALAAQLALQTVAGAAAYAAASDTAPATLREQVTSPGGTTQAALSILMAANDGLAEMLHEAVRAAAERSRELAANQAGG